MKMKSKLIVVGLIVILALSLLACATAPKEASVEVPIDDFMSQNHISKQVEVAAGGLLTVTLGSNPTTGFNWQPAVISDDSVLKQEGESEFVPPAEAIPGAGGKEIWTFKALKKGTSTISMEYSRPWEGGEKGEWTFNLTVTVK
jgi:inhibitor of cysteine peptidase